VIIDGGAASTAIPASADVAGYALALGDDALILAQRLSAWSSLAPDLEEDIALTNIALDLLGQARSLLTYAGSFDGRTEDDLAYLRHEPDFRNVHLVELPNGDFGMTIARQLVFSTYQFLLYEALASSVDETLAGVAAKAVKEVAYHRDHAVQWTFRLGDGIDESHRRMQAGLDRVWPYTAELFDADETVRRLAADRVAVDPTTLGREWTVQMSHVVSEATLDMPDAPPRITGGRRGRHTEMFGYLLAEMQHLHRSYPGATW
jgi:ring-1,2-phenylacetyl-CoA epoxidase subunit PaaC